MFLCFQTADELYNAGRFLPMGTHIFDCPQYCAQILFRLRSKVGSNFCRSRARLCPIYLAAYPFPNLARALFTVMILMEFSLYMYMYYIPKFVQRSVSGAMAQSYVAPKVLLNGVLAEHIAEEHLNTVAQQVFGRCICDPPGGVSVAQWVYPTM